VTFSANNKILIGLQKLYYIKSPKPLAGLRRCYPGREGRREKLERREGRGEDKGYGKR